MMGCHMSTVTEVVAQVCTQYGVPMITAISTLDRLTDADHEDMDFFFRLCPLNSVYVEDMLKYLKDSAQQTGEEIILPKQIFTEVNPQTRYTVKFDVAKAGSATIEITLNDTLVGQVTIDNELNDDALPE
jgi:hypothetical protein